MRVRGEARLKRFWDGAAPGVLDWTAARRLPDAEGSAWGPLGARRRLPWNGVRPVECRDLRRGLGADQATDLTARALLADAHLLRGASVCETGCGTAVLGVLAAARGAARVVAIDCDPAALACARRTAATNGVRIEIRRGDLLRGVREHFDVLIANLPQKPVPPRARLPLGQDGGPDGNSLLRSFLTQGAGRLGPGGRLYCFLHTLTDPDILNHLAARFDRAAVRLWRRRHIPPGEYPDDLLAYWLGRAARGRALIHPRPGRPGWHTFYAAQLTATPRRPGKHAAGRL